jgi:hypothetical protein
MELGVVITVYLMLGVGRPRWTTLLAAGPAAAIAFVWLLTHEQVPGERIGAIDVFWYAAISFALGAALALVSVVGIVVRRTMIARLRLLGGFSDEPW